MPPEKLLLVLVLTVAACQRSDVSKGPAPSHDRSAISSLSRDDGRALAVSADALGDRVSPWHRAITRAARQRRVAPFTVPRPTGRTETDPDAPQIEAATIAALERLDRLEPAPDRAAARTKLLALLVEVAGASGCRHLRSMVEGARTDVELLPAMRALETVYGLPPFYEPAVVNCGEGGPPEQMAAARAAYFEAEAAARARGRKALLAWVDENGALSRAARADRALSVWDARHWYAQPNDPPFGIDRSAPLRFAPVLRLGDDAIDGLRARKVAAATDLEAARYEILLAAITGQEDLALVNRLLVDGGRERLLAIAIIGACGGRKWVGTLDQLQLSQEIDVAEAASGTLASLLGAAAQPLLTAASQSNPGNATARYAAEDLESEP